MAKQLIKLTKEDLEKYLTPAEAEEYIKGFQRVESYKRFFNEGIDSIGTPLLNPEGLDKIVVELKELHQTLSPLCEKYVDGKAKDLSKVLEKGR